MATQQQKTTGHVKTLAFNIDGPFKFKTEGIEFSKLALFCGPNGSGKSSLVKIAVGLLRPNTGTRQLLPNINIGYMPQALKLDKSLPISVQHFLQLTAHRPKTPQIVTALAEVGVERLLKSSVHSLSGGEWQRVLLARALLQQPDLLVLDEPMQGVDLTGQEELYNLLADVPKRHGCGILMVSHDLHLVMAATDKVICLNGHICCEGHPEAVSTHPEYLRLFGWQKNIKKPIGITFIQGFEIDINDSFYCLKIGHLLHLCKGGFLRLLFAMGE